MPLKTRGMSTRLRTIAGFLLTLFLLSAPADAQDGWLLSAKPPIVFRFGNGLNFTNTSDKPIHGITLHGKTAEGAPTSLVIIDTISPHRTVTIENAQALVMIAGGATITCTNHSKPLAISLTGASD